MSSWLDLWPGWLVLKPGWLALRHGWVVLRLGWLALRPGQGDEHMDVPTDVGNFSPFYRTSSLIGAAAQKYS